MALLSSIRARLLLWTKHLVGHPYSSPLPPLLSSPPLPCQPNFKPSLPKTTGSTSFTLTRPPLRKYDTQTKQTEASSFSTVICPDPPASGWWRVGEKRTYADLAFSMWDKNFEIIMRCGLRGCEMRAHSRS